MTADSELLKMQWPQLLEAVHAQALKAQICSGPPLVFLSHRLLQIDAASDEPHDAHWRGAAGALQLPPLWVLHALQASRQATDPGVTLTQQLISLQVAWAVNRLEQVHAGRWENLDVERIELQQRMLEVTRLLPEHLARLIGLSRQAGGAEEAMLKMAEHLFLAMTCHLALFGAAQQELAWEMRAGQGPDVEAELARARAVLAAAHEDYLNTGHATAADAAHARLLARQLCLQSEQRMRGRS